ncbi:methyltransferase [Jatrophihabitans sp.]|uniref:methyltransferase n=1 Tax=Jatrophihabitans sp. TaxID=1932789 RepID=UPI002B686380|nr:methyltransferase [Jatrophihabitans sp.]
MVNLATPFAIRVVASLQVADQLAAGVHDVNAIAAAVGADPDALDRLLRYLVHQGVFTEDGKGHFDLTEVSRELLDRSPAGMGRWLDLENMGGRMDLAYTGLLHSVRTGEVAYPVVHGLTFWEDLDAEEHRRFIDELMVVQGSRTSPQVAELYDWSAVTEVCDVGGGSGILLSELLGRHPHLRGTLVDLPNSPAVARQLFAERGLTDRTEIVTGSFFDPLPAGRDVYTISRAVTDWPDAEATRVLRRMAEAAGVGGRVLVIEVLPTDPQVPYATSFDLEMLVTVGGRERTGEDFDAIAADAGLVPVGVYRGRQGLVLLEYACAPR